MLTASVLLILALPVASYMVDPRTGCKKVSLLHRGDPADSKTIDGDDCGNVKQINGMWAKSKKVGGLAGAAKAAAMGAEQAATNTGDAAASAKKLGEAVGLKGKIPEGVKLAVEAAEKAGKAASKAATDLTATADTFSGKFADFANTKSLLSAGDPCDASSGISKGICGDGLACTCLAQNRGLHICMRPKLLTPPRFALKWERRGLICDSRLPGGLEVMPPPPVAASGTKVVDPRDARDAKLRQWALGTGRGFYTQYAVVHAPGGTTKGVPILAGNDVSKDKMIELVNTVQHLLREAAVDSETLTSALADSGVRILIGGKEKGAWRKHPEVKRHFTTGLGGGAPWFPSTGVQSNEPNYLLMEEIFHTIQYVAMQPLDVCMYHKAYAQAVAGKLYTTDGSADEIDGEPVPTVQADEYLAMALQRWIGSHSAPKEYHVPGNDQKLGKPTGRENLRSLDPQAFCLIAKVFRSDDTWNPRPKAHPWKTNPNRGMDVGEVASFCKPILANLAVGCPSASLRWPHSLAGIRAGNISAHML